MPKWATTAASILLVVLGAILLTLSLAALLAGCASMPQQEQDEAPQSKPAKKPEPNQKEPPPDVEAFSKAFSEKYAEIESKRAAKYHTAVRDGRMRDACEIDNGFILETQQLCREAPPIFDGCWLVMKKELSSCMDKSNAANYPPLRGADPEPEGGTQ